MKFDFGKKIKTRSSISAKKQKKYRFFAVFSAVFCVLAAVVIATVLLFVLLKPYKVRKIIYKSPDSAFEKAAAPYASEYLGVNVIREKSDKRLPALEQEITHCLPEYKNVKCEIKFGGTLTVSGEQRSSFVVFVDGDSVVVTDRDGYVVLISDLEKYREDVANVPAYDGDNVDVFVKGFDLTLCTLGERVIHSGGVPWKTVAEVYFSVLANDSLVSNIGTVFFMAGENLYFNCKNNIYVNMGSYEDSDLLFERLERLTKIFNIENFDFKDGTIFMKEEGFDTFKPNNRNENETKIEIDH